MQTFLAVLTAKAKGQRPWPGLTLQIILNLFQLLLITIHFFVLYSLSVFKLAKSLQLIRKSAQPTDFLGRKIYPKLLQWKLRVQPLFFFFSSFPSNRSFFFCFPFPSLLWFWSFSGVRNLSFDAFSLKWLQISLGWFSKNRLGIFPMIYLHCCADWWFRNTIRKFAAQATNKNAKG